MMYDIGDIVCVLPYDEVPDSWGLSERQWKPMLNKPLEIIQKDEIGYRIKYYDDNHREEYWWIYEDSIKGLYETDVSLPDIISLV